jgi:hypothetical protein
MFLMIYQKNEEYALAQREKTKIAQQPRSSRNRAGFGDFAPISRNRAGAPGLLLLKIFIVQ